MSLWIMLPKMSGYEKRLKEVHVFFYQECVIIEKMQ